MGSRNSQPSGRSPDSRASLGELAAKRLGLGEVDVAHGVVVPLGQLRRRLARQLSDDRASIRPVSTSYLPAQKPRVSVTSTWASSGRRSGSPGGLPIVNRARRAPAEVDARDELLLAGLLTVERVLRGGEGRGDGERQAQS